MTLAVALALALTAPAAAVTINTSTKTVTAARVAMEFTAANPNDPERVTSLKWIDSDGVQTANLASSGGSSCGEPVEFFGQSYGGAGGFVVAGSAGTWTSPATATVQADSTTGTSCGANIPVRTTFTFYDASPAYNQIALTRRFDFTSTHPTGDIRAYVPRLDVTTYSDTIYPSNGASPTLKTVAASSCGGGCVEADWNGTWFALNSPRTSRGLLVLRDAGNKVAGGLMVDNDSFSNSNLSAVDLTTSGTWTGLVSETEYLCLYDLKSWPQARRNALQPPAGCGPFPANLTAPTITGEAAVGRQLTANPGTWTSSPTFTYQWRRCAASGASCADIPGATGQSYTVQAADAGSVIVVRVVAKAAAGSSSADSRATGAVPAPPAAAAAASTATPPVAGPPTSSTGAPSVGDAHGAALSAVVNPNGLATTVHFEYGLDASLLRAALPFYDQRTPDQAIPADFADHAVTATLTDLLGNATYHVRVVATHSAGTVAGADQVFKTPVGKPPPPPVLGKEVNAEAVQGLVFVKVPAGAGRAALPVKGAGFLPLTEARQLPVGTEVDARRGTIELDTATTKVGKTQSGRLGGGLFRIAQSRARAAKGLTELRLLQNTFAGSPSTTICKAAGKPRARKKAGDKVVQLLRANVHGKFRTRGHFAAATVRGTQFDVTDRCDGTLTVVHRGTVVVTDFRRHKDVVVRAGKSYLAKAPSR